ncbi:MAG: hypothetical protein Fues2KO_23310 [Fuerstiella sp.]
MPEGANVRSVDSIRRFKAMVLQFQEEARLCLSSLELNIQKFSGWLERERPGFWKREIEACYQQISEARVRLHQCQMRKVGDFRPTCHEEQKALEQAKRNLDFAQKQVPVVKYWNTVVQQEANEYHGRSSQLVQVIERELPQLIAILNHTIDRLEAYGNVTLPDAAIAAFASQEAPEAQNDVQQTTEEHDSDDTAEPNDGQDSDPSPSPETSS